MTDLIEVKTADLVGEALGWAVGKAAGLDVLLAPPIYGNPWRVFARYTGEVIIRDVRYNPWEDWAVGGHLIQKYRVGFGLYLDSLFAVTGLDDISGDADGPTHLIAACRAVVAAKLGDTVQVPKELMLDPCSASRMMWFDKHDQRALFGDIRDEEHLLCDGRVLKVEPDVLMDFRSLPFEASAFRLVVFDPPHLTRAGIDSWMRAKYGLLTSDWREDIRQGFAECFRVLEPEGILIFKWNETQVLVSELLALTDEKPLFGHKSGKREKTHWITFMKRPAA